MRKKKTSTEITRANMVLTWLVLSACAILSLFYSIHGCEVGEVDRVDTVFHHDTVVRQDTLYAYISNPIPKYIYKIRTDTVYNGVGDTLLVQREIKIYNDTLCAQNDTAIVTSYIQGIDASLDSIKLELWKRDSIITNTIEVTKYIKKKEGRFHHGLQLGIGFNPLDSRVSPFIGYGVVFSPW